MLIFLNGVQYTAVLAHSLQNPRLFITMHVLKENSSSFEYIVPGLIVHF